MIIDSNVYWLPQAFFNDGHIRKQFLAEISADEDTKATFKKSDSDLVINIEKPIGQPSLDYFASDYKLGAQLADMETGHVDKAVLKAPGCQEWMSLDLCKLYNKNIAKYIDDSHGRMVALAVVPPYGHEAELAELDHCIHDLGLKGVQVSAHYGDKYLDDMSFRPFLSHVEKLGIPVYVHHTPVPVEYASIKDYANFRRSYGRCADQIIAVSREVFSNLFAELPHLKMVHSMLGGGYFTYKDMFIPHDSGKGRFDTNTADQIEQRLNQNIYFEMSHAQPWGPENLKVAIKKLGSKKVIYGSSYPVKQVWMTKGPEYMQELGLDSRDFDAVLGENAKRIYQC
ncbi:amidohydrolase [Lacticaseibacillus zeae]|uniref:Amidohydrolase n=1 Tax=Lacticaseibacillus zeae TaxID=57037 RepID=A0A5R8LNY5_LACZE|nr:amidohydrolase [Lacticaseibacillus zeae]